MISSPDYLRIRSIILDKAKEKGGVIYGARAINVQLPTYLRKKTEDYDIMVKKPKKVAQEALESIKKVTAHDVKLEKAKHKGTYKIKVGGKTIVDFTQLKRKLKTKKVLGDKYYNIKSIKQSTARLAKKPGAEFRRDKDLSTLDRIKQLEDLERRFNIGK